MADEQSECALCKLTTEMVPAAGQPSVFLWQWVSGVLVCSTACARAYRALHNLEVQAGERA